MQANGAFLAEYWATHDGMQQAHQLLERMRLTKVPAEPYIEAAIIDAVYKVSQHVSLHHTPVAQS